MSSNDENIFDGIIEDIYIDKFLKPEYNMFLSALQKYVNDSKRQKIRCLLFFFENDFPEEINIRDTFVVSKKFGDLFKFKLKRNIKSDEIRVLEGKFILKRLDDEKYIAITIEDRDFFENGLKKFLGYLQPYYKKPLLTSEEMLKILHFYQENNQNKFKVIPKKAVFYNRDEEAQISYNIHDLEEISEKCLIENMYIDKLNFDFIENKNNTIIFSGAIERDGTIEFNEGNVKHFNELIENIFKPAKRKSEVFSRSDRNNYKELAKKCIKISFDNPVLSHPDDNKRFFNKIGELPKSEFLVFHYNPYLHVSFFDYSDGSKFDIFGLSDKIITIIPHQSATEASFLNLLDKIERDFAEGVIDEYETPEFDLKDIMA